MKRAIPVVCLSFLAGIALAQQPRSIGGCTMFPANNVWNTPVNTLPVSPNSAAYVASIGTSAHLFTDFWSDAGGMFLNIVPASQPRVPITVYYASEADPGPYPLPPNALVEDGTDQHVLVLSQGNCKLYETWDAVPQSNGSWTVGSGAVYDLQSNIQRPSTWTSSNAAGLPMMVGVVTYDEVMAGQINHAIGMTAPQTQNTFIWPATHEAGIAGTQYPPMGQRFRLNAGFDISPYPQEVQVILTALKKYGAILNDNGAAWFLDGLQDPRWNDDNLHTITQVLGSNMEAVDESSLMVSANSATVAGSPLALDGIYLDQRLVSAGMVVNAQAILTAPAPAGGAVVTLTNSNPAAVSMPASVTVAAGSATASFTVTVNSIALTTPVTIYGAYNSVTRNSPELLVTAASGQAAPMLSALAVSPTVVIGGVSATATVTLTGPAPAGGTVVPLTGSNGAAVTVPGSITVPAGATSATVPLATNPQSSVIAVNVSAMLNGEGLSTPLTLTPANTAPLPSIRINAGGPAYTDPSGNVWSADTDFTGGTPSTSSSAIAGTSTPALYQTYRYGPFSYQATVPNGSYNVTLKFAETSVTGVGQRRFDVAINGSPALADFDVYAAAGFATAIDKTFPVTVSNGQILIEFEMGPVNDPMVSAIAIVSSSGGGTTTTSAFTPIRVNAGGSGYTDPSGNVWSADTGFSGGYAWSTTAAIGGTSTPSLYQSCRWGAFSYTFPVPNGNYTVSLKFAEVSMLGAGQRQFNAAINGTAVLTNFDIYAQAGGLTALDKSFPVTVSNGQIVIQFTQGAANYPLVSGIEIVTPSTAPASAIRVNAGGQAYTDPSGKVWSADAGFSGGYTWSTTAAIGGTTTPSLYQSCRWGAFSYTFSVPNGNYTVNLKFAEASLQGAGQRQFNAAINGAAVLTNFDIYAQAGWLTAIDKSFPVTVSNGQIVIQFTQGAANYPLVSGIEIVTASSSSNSPIRVNAGGAGYTDSTGSSWSADMDFSGGSPWSTSGAIGGTSDPTLYQSCRWGAFTYTFNVPNGNYSVILKFAEISLDGAGRRVFNVGINGAPVLTNFDIFAQAGWQAALDKSFPVTVSNGQIAVQFTQGAADWPLVNGIEVIPQ